MSILSMNMKKEITKFYSLHYIAQKNRLNHEYLKKSIIPEEYWVKHGYQDEKRGDACHYYHGTCSLDSFYCFTESVAKPVELIKRKHRPAEIRITICKGTICRKCLFLKSHYHKYNEPQDEFDEFAQISSRDDLAKYIRKARKSFVDLDENICRECNERMNQIESEQKWRLSQIELDEKLNQIFNESVQDPVQQRSMQKWLYVMKCSSTGFYKIGVSNNPAHREKTLQSEKPTIKLIAKWENAVEWERHWHEHFAMHRIRGEWFNLTKCQVAFLCSTMTKAKKKHDALPA